MNILLSRTVPYDQNGRFQTEDEAKNIDDKIKNTLDESEIPYMIINGNVDGYKAILDIILEKLNKRR
jgi:nicotinamide riboside kinase